MVTRSLVAVPAKTLRLANLTGRKFAQARRLNSVRLKRKSRDMRFRARRMRDGSATAIINDCHTNLARLAEFIVLSHSLAKLLSATSPTANNQQVEALTPAAFSSVINSSRVLVSAAPIVHSAPHKIGVSAQVRSLPVTPSNESASSLASCLAAWLI